jgi:hypothetical protein
MAWQAHSTRTRTHTFTFAAEAMKNLITCHALRAVFCGETFSRPAAAAMALAGVATNVAEHRFNSYALFVLARAAHY